MNTLSRRALTCLLCLFVAGFAYSETTITEHINSSVTSVDAGGPRDQVRLKQAAVLLAKTRFPVLVEGQETLIGVLGIFPSKVT